MSVEKYSHVMHLVSKVTGLLGENFSGIDALKSGFPIGTLSGAPKIRAIELANDLFLLINSSSSSSSFLFLVNLGYHFFTFYFPT